MAEAMANETVDQDNLVNEIKELENSASDQTEAQPEEITLEQRVMYHERVLGELFTGYEQAGKAVNRVEQFLFCTIRILIDKGILDFNQLGPLCDELLQSEDLLKFWGVSEEPAEDSSEEVTNDSEEDSEEEAPVA